MDKTSVRVPMPGSAAEKRNETTMTIVPRTYLYQVASHGTPLEQYLKIEYGARTIVLIHEQEIIEVLIPSLTPQNLERDDLWFKENTDAIKKSRATNHWWRQNVIIIEKDQMLKPAIFTRALLDLGYGRVPVVRGRGLFAVRGGIVELWPAQSPRPYLIEFRGNTLVALRERPEVEQTHVPRPVRVQKIEALGEGSFVVHVDHGIGIFRRIINTNGERYFAVEYAPSAPGREPDRLLVPTDQEERLTPYAGFETPRVHRLGGTVWHTTKRKVREDTEKLAKELLQLYAKRSQAERSPYAGDQTLADELRETFPYVETEDQHRAEADIMKDFAGIIPMDRILCGDVGFGKTEIALRAALHVIASGKQVALLSPTTILAAQHERTFQERLAQFPVTVRMLSRLTPPKEEKKILEGLAAGHTDCVVGTHRLLSQDVRFKNLGFVIIDEEQRFGVKQKERFKEMRAEVDLLSLSATPIPRTMQLALAKLRDISLIETPPPDRLPIHTFVLPYSKKIIRTAIEFEQKRGGQIYFLHNRIETIGHVQKKLAALKLPRQLKIETMHGRMDERKVVRAMESFREKKSDLLLATTIIENGLDISSANTLIVDDATQLGLAQAHQLRGRIGRSAKQAFAYFLYRPNRMTEKAQERLDALQKYAELGAGYQIATRDLEIRGAGNILGREQSGAINKVGLNLYYHMLAEAIETEKQKETHARLE